MGQQSVGIPAAKVVVLRVVAFNADGMKRSRGHYYILGIPLVRRATVYRLSHTGS